MHQICPVSLHNSNRTPLKAPSAEHQGDTKNITVSLNKCKGRGTPLQLRAFLSNQIQFTIEPQKLRNATKSCLPVLAKTFKLYHKKLFKGKRTYPMPKCQKLEINPLQNPSVTINCNSVTDKSDIIVSKC